MGPRDTSSTVLSTSEEAMIVAFRKYPLLPLDDCLYALQASIPKLTRSSPHRCLQRHGISRLPDSKDEQQGKKKFKAYPIGFFHIDIAEVRTDEGKLYLFVAIDRTSKFVLARLFTRVTMAAAKTFLEELIRTVPYKIHTVLADNGIQFADRTQYLQALQLCTEVIPLIVSVGNTTLSIDCRNSIIHGRMGRWNE